jgi:tetratricopeptide (TPR) repeat protein
MWSEGDLEKAKVFFKKAVNIEMENADFWVMYAKVQAELNDIKHAISSFDMATKLEKENIDIWLSYSEMFYDIGDTDRAIEVLKTANKFNKSNAFLNYRLTAYLLQKNEELEAACHFEKALKIDFNKQNELFEFYPEASKNESIRRLISQYKTTKL